MFNTFRRTRPRPEEVPAPTTAAEITPVADSPPELRPIAERQAVVEARANLARIRDRRAELEAELEAAGKRTAASRAGAVLRRETLRAAEVIRADLAALDGAEREARLAVDAARNRARAELVDELRPRIQELERRSRPHAEALAEVGEGAKALVMKARRAGLSDADPVAGELRRFFR